MGYPRQTGDAGTRNVVAVIASVICSTAPVEEIARSVPGAVAITHSYGCSQVGDDLSQTRRTLIGTAAHPNVSAVLVVGLGCETNQADEFAAMIPQNKPISVLGIQQLGGSLPVVRQGVEIVGREADNAFKTGRQPVGIQGLTVGVLAIDVDESAGEHLFPAIGALVDEISDAGGRVILGLSKPLAPAGSKLAERAVASDAKQTLQHLARGLTRRRWQEIQGDWNVGRPWTPEEQAVADQYVLVTGKAPIQGMVSFAEGVKTPGLHLMSVPSNPLEAMAGLVAGGANLIVVASKRGILSGSPIAPTVVVTPADPENDWFSDLVDFQVDPDRAPVGEAQRLLGKLLDIASGEMTALEREGMADFSIPKIGTSY